MDKGKRFEEVYLDLRAPLYWYVVRKVSDKEVAEDIVAEVFMRLFEKDDLLMERDIVGIKRWLYTVARNLVIDMYRKKSGKELSIAEEFYEIIPSGDEDALTGLMKNETDKKLWDAVSMLNPFEQEVLILKYKDEFKFNEIAKIVSKEEGAVKMALYRALDKLKALLGN